MYLSFIEKWANPGLFFVYFRSFSNKHYKFLQQIFVKKYPSSIRCPDSNPRPLECESPSITTRPGLPPCISLFDVSCNNLINIRSLRRHSNSPDVRCNRGGFRGVGHRRRPLVASTSATFDESRIPVTPCTCVLVIVVIELRCFDQVAGGPKKRF